jgi:hypothetical protein
MTLSQAKGGRCGSLKTTTQGVMVTGDIFHYADCAYSAAGEELEGGGPPQRH